MSRAVSRAEAARRIGRLKADAGQKPYVAAREVGVYRRVIGENRGPLPDEALKAIYREIMSACIALERPTRASYFGAPGSFTHLAAKTKFGSQVEYLPCRDLRDVFLAVSRGHVDYGVIPIENSTEGGVNQAMDIFTDTNLKIAAEIYLPVHHHLLSNFPLHEIKVVFSHPHAFAQCRNWLTANLPDVERREVGSTSLGAEMAARMGNAAAIAGEMAAAIYELQILYRNIEDNPENVTRFVVLAEKSGPPSGRDKTSLLFWIKDAPGALVTMLEPFRRFGINLTRIESRPSKRKPWEYYFFVDLEGHVEDPPVAQALAELESLCKHIEILGSYPAAGTVLPPASEEPQRSS
ncbi:MAG: prephenate dehydratase [Planctomycetota bacterium]|nr:prephenate dehydratase [Planctomycetota bacterium]